MPVTNVVESLLEIEHDAAAIPSGLELGFTKITTKCLENSVLLFIYFPTFRIVFRYLPDCISYLWEALIKLSFDRVVHGLNKKDATFAAALAKKS